MRHATTPPRNDAAERAASATPGFWFFRCGTRRRGEAATLSPALRTNTATGVRSGGFGFDFSTGMEGRPRFLTEARPRASAASDPRASRTTVETRSGMIAFLLISPQGTASRFISSPAGTGFARTPGGGSPVLQDGRAGARVSFLAGQPQIFQPDNSG